MLGHSLITDCLLVSQTQTIHTIAKAATESRNLLCTHVTCLFPSQPPSGKFCFVLCPLSLSLCLYLSRILFIIHDIGLSILLILLLILILILFFFLFIFFFIFLLLIIFLLLSIFVSFSSFMMLPFLSSSSFEVIIYLSPSCSLFTHLHCFANSPSFFSHHFLFVPPIPWPSQMTADLGCPVARLPALAVQLLRATGSRRFYHIEKQATETNLEETRYRC